VKAIEQLRWLSYELALAVNHRYWRWVTIFSNGNTFVTISYRLDRFCYLVFARYYVAVRVLLFPLFGLFNLLGSRHEIHYQADIGKGLKILHASLGVVVSKYAVCGEHLTLTGGNCIGGRTALKSGDVWLGNHVSLGANAVVLGPVRLGDRCVIGAGAVVLKDAPADSVLVGVPARNVMRENVKREA
jgi:serine O-acetyltransferase